MDVTYIPYNGGDYWTPPEGGYHECDSFEIINIEYNMNDEYNGSLKQKPEGLEEFIYQYVMEEIDEKYDEEVQAKVQRFREIPDDKGGLLRAFIQQEYLKKRYGD